MEELNKFYANNKELCLAFKSWIARNAKQFSLVDGLKAVYDYCNGSHKMMKDVLTQFKETMKRKVQGRTQVYGGMDTSLIDIIPDENGQLTVVGYASDREKPLTGQHRVEDPTKTKSGAVSKNVLRSKEKLEQIGKRLRDIFPGKNVEYLKNVELAVYRFAKERKISQMRVVDGLENGKYMVTFDNKIRKVTVVDENRNRVVYINESTANELRNAVKMTEHKFYSNVKKFLHDLLVNPVNADVSPLLKLYGYSRNNLLKLLKENNIIIKKQKIVDKGKDGQPMTPVMRVSYNIQGDAKNGDIAVPKKDFNNKLKRLYIQEFERNVVNEECACGGDGCFCGGEGMTDGTSNASSSGQIVQPLSSNIISPVGYNGNRNKRKKKEIDETTATTNVGDYQYTVPFPGDEETLSRPNGGICVTVVK